MDTTWFHSLTERNVCRNGGSEAWGWLPGLWTTASKSCTSITTSASRQCRTRWTRYRRACCCRRLRTRASRRNWSWTKEGIWRRRRPLRDLGTFPFFAIRILLRTWRRETSRISICKPKTSFRVQYQLLTKLLMNYLRFFGFFVQLLEQQSFHRVYHDLNSHNQSRTCDLD